MAMSVVSPDELAIHAEFNSPPSPLYILFRMPYNGGRMRIAIVGSRGFHHLHKVRNYIATIPTGATVVSGSNAIGVNECALTEASRKGLTAKAITPDFKKHGKRTSVEHMNEILRNSEHVVVFWDGKSTGSKLFIDMARCAGKSIQIIR